jgi:recombination protein RecA
MERVRLVQTASRAEGGGNYFGAPKSDIQFITSGCKNLDLAMGGGWAEGRVANVIGDKSSGKTLLCIEAAANFAAKYRKGKYAKQKIRYRERESAFSNSYAGAIGMPLDRVDFGDQYDTVEGFFGDLRAIVKGARGPELIILDSLDALSDDAEMKREMDKGSYGGDKAKKMSQLFRRLVRPMERKMITLIIVSQVRDKIGAMFGRKWTRTGGRALDFYASQAVVLSQRQKITETIRKQKRTTGVEVVAMLDKNKVGLPFRSAQFTIKFGYGIDDAEACINFLEETGGLRRLGIKDPDRYLTRLERMDASDYRAEMSEVHEAVDRIWWDIEKKLLPTRSKYGE